MTTSTFSTESLDVREPATAARTSLSGRIDTARFWVGTALTAGISALAAFIALIISNDLLHIPVLIREGGHLVAVGYGAYALIAAAAAVTASVLYTVLLHFAPRPGLYYGWIVGLVTAAGRAASAHSAHRGNRIGRPAGAGRDQSGHWPGDHLPGAGGCRPGALIKSTDQRALINKK